MPATTRHALLSEIPPVDDLMDELRIVIEAPRRSRNKYKYEPDWNCVRLSTVLPDGMVFPYDFGFIRSTMGDDGDPLDILILMDSSVGPVCVVQGRLIVGANSGPPQRRGRTRRVRSSRWA